MSLQRSECYVAEVEMTAVRKVVQISTMVHAEKDWAFIALCDDGSLWLYHGSWSRIEVYRRLLIGKAA